MSHWFQGWKLQPNAPRGPVDDEYRQLRWLKPYRIGIARSVLSMFGVVVFMIPMYITIIVLLSPGTALVPRLVITGSFALITTGVGIVVARLFATGVYVNDLGIRVISTRGLTALPWSDVADISSADGRVRVLGLPLVHTQGHFVVVTTRDHGPVRTPVTSTGLDFFGRAEAYDAAALALERRWRDAGGEARRAT